MCRIEYQLPNLIVGAITKESLYHAFANGITAEQASLSITLLLHICKDMLHFRTLTLSYMQIISFLQQNAHPRVAQRLPSVPENVTDQVNKFFPMYTRQQNKKLKKCI